MYERELLLSYTICPHEVVQITSNGVCQAVHTTHAQIPCHGCIIRGGTPGVRLLTDEYLSFFHTHVCPYEHPRKTACEVQWPSGTIPLRHYLMGCYTFEAIPPFRILRCSPEPIVYPGICDSHNPRFPKHKVVFPAGLIVEDGEAHVSCGENDGCVKIISFPLDELLASLVCLPLDDGG